MPEVQSIGGRFTAVVVLTLATLTSEGAIGHTTGISTGAEAGGPIPGPKGSFGTIAKASEGSALRHRVRELARQWIEETTISSSNFMNLVTNQAYQRIIGLGPGAVPFILEELAGRPDHWAWALQAITGENPVPAEAAGDVDAIARAWLEWGKTHRLI